MPTSALDVRNEQPVWSFDAEPATDRVGCQDGGRIRDGVTPCAWRVAPRQPLVRTIRSTV
jgi:hypothetical protein